MPKNRIIGEEYWSHFIEMDNKTNRMKHNGHEFEKLVHCLLQEMYSGTIIKCEQTQTTHDGNKDFKARDNDKIYWAECKNYNTTIDLKTLAATLVMAEIENVNVILFFCYSPINENTKTKLSSFSKSTNKTIYFYDGNLLDQLILKYQETILPAFFPEFHRHLAKHDIIGNQISPLILCYAERNPFLDKTSSFNLQKLDELQDLQLGEIVGIHLIVTNNNLNQKADCVFKLEFTNNEKSFEILDEVENSRNGACLRNITILSGETIHKVIFMKLQNHAPIVNLPNIKCIINKRQECTFSFGTIRTLRTRQIAYIGQKYIERKEYLCKKCINKKQLSIMFIYGGSGTGKSRMLHECMDKFISAGYQIITFTGVHSTYSASGILQELIFSLYGFTDEIIEYIIQNNYEELEFYTSDKYRGVFKILKIIHDNKSELSSLKVSDLFVLFEKLASAKYFILIDDIQYWPDELIEFLRSFISYANNMQRHCYTVIAIAANTDVLHKVSTIEFLSQLESNSETYRKNICSYEITGFETEQQSYLFLSEVLGIDGINLDINMINKFSFKPKYLTEIANYLLDINAITITNNRGLVGDTYFLKQALSKLPASMHDIIDNRWEIYLANCKTSRDDYELIISCILFLESVDLLYDSIGQKYKSDILKLSQYGFLKKKFNQSSIYVFEHDTIKIYFKTKYCNWLDVAISYYTMHNDFSLKPTLNRICEIYKSPSISYQTYLDYMDDTCSNDIRYSITERIIRIILMKNKENSYLLLQRIFRDVRENYGEKDVEHFYQLFIDWYDGNTRILELRQYCILVMSYAENQLKLKNTKNAIALYEKLILILSKNPFEDSNYYLAQIYNRWFICGRIGSYTQEFSSKLDISTKLSRKNGYHAMCIENHFDKAQSMMIYADKKTEVLRHLKVGCETYKLYEPEELSGHYFYRSIQIDFLESKFSCIKNKIWDYEYRILNDEKITYKLFFRVQFLIFKVMLYLMDKTEYTDFEINNYLENLNLYQTMQNKLQLYRCYYLYGKYYTKKHMWDEALLFYKKTLDNLNENINTEEIHAQKKAIFEDMLINFKKNKFPFKQYDFGYFESTMKEFSFEKIVFYSDEEFERFFNTYNSSAIISTSEKEGFLLF